MLLEKTLTLPDCRKGSLSYVPRLINQLLPWALECSVMSSPPSVVCRYEAGHEFLRVFKVWKGKQKQMLGTLIEDEL